MITSINEFKKYLLNINETKKHVDVKSPDSFVLCDRLKGKKGIFDVGCETVTKARVYYNDKVYNEGDILAMVKKENETIEESKKILNRYKLNENCDMSKIDGLSQITSKEDVLKFFQFLHNDCNVSFHPDDLFTDYVDEMMEPFFSEDEATKLQEIMDKCFDYCEQNGCDIYEIGIESAKQSNMYGI